MTFIETCGFAKWTVEEQLLKDYHASARELLVGIKKIGAQSHCFSARGFCLKGGDIFKLAVFLNSRYREGKGVYILIRFYTNLPRRVGKLIEKFTSRQHMPLISTTRRMKFG
ncbi:hypothetical protein [Desulforamulus putei]|uniref:Uncharacterized protein n=1 Tax=Desulforamulus putei DSM 12395 TaxID=1121429 RepID=A0A1M4WBY9_9FIRM|nr:hypothetical protein [Desulforamulus putei]SHE78685.1 hypothetical protein SAMN02745133_01130 [Desulforamulus putei DSM 12395]